MLGMLTCKDILLRTLIWLAVVAVPIHGLPAASSGCSGDDSCCTQRESAGCRCSVERVRRGQCCCKRKPSCCSARKKAEVDRSCQERGDSTCHCGANCQCGRTQQPPAAPLPENTKSEKLADEILASDLVSVYVHVQPAKQNEQASPTADANSALDRCVSLCRFTL